MLGSENDYSVPKKQSKSSFICERLSGVSVMKADGGLLFFPHTPCMLRGLCILVGHTACE